MAVSSRSSSTWMFSLKVILTSTAIFSIAVILKLSVPAMLQFLVSEVPTLWSSVLSWLTPPYLYVVINGIIITIAASSRFHNKVDEEHHSGTVAAPLKVPVSVDFSVYDSVVSKSSAIDFSVDNVYDPVVLQSPAEIRSDFVGAPVYNAGVVKNRNDVPEKKVYREEKSLADSVKSFVSVTEGGDDGFVISRSNWTPSPIQKDSREIRNEFSFPAEKPLVSVRFSHRKIPKASPEGGNKAAVLKVTKPKRHDTLESTWKTITDGRPMPLARHLKKSDTWERQHHTAGPQEPSSPKMKKCETFKDRTNNLPSLTPSPVSGKLKKEASLSQDDLNRRVEAFINKFNEEMRLQRQESLNQYHEMMHRR